MSLIVKPNEEDLTTKSGLIVPNSQVKTITAKVSSVGEGRYIWTNELVPLSVKEWDTVAFLKGRGIEIESDWEKFLILNDHEILCVVDKD